MYKKLLLGFVVLAIAGVATFNMSVNSRSGLSDIALANVEALAKNEGSGNCFIYCTPSWWHDCTMEVNNSGTWVVLCVFEYFRN